MIADPNKAGLKKNGISSEGTATGLLERGEADSGRILILAEKALHYLYRSMMPSGMHLAFLTFQEAGEFLGSGHADVAIIDAGYDPERGLKLLREIKTSSFETPVIFISERTAPERVREAYRSGARDYLEKPVNVNELRRMLESLLEIKKTSREKRHPFFPEWQSPARDSMTEITSDKPAYIIKAIGYIEDNLSSKISLGGIAREANFSKYHFCRIFCKYTGMTPFRFASVMRIEKSKELLAREDLSVSQIASQVGFNDLGTFLRQFKKIAGTTPTKYRSGLRDAKKSGDFATRTL